MLCCLHQVEKFSRKPKQKPKTQKDVSKFTLSLLHFCNQKGRDVTTRRSPKRGEQQEKPNNFDLTRTLQHLLCCQVQGLAALRGCAQIAACGCTWARSKDPKFCTGQLPNFLKLTGLPTGHAKWFCRLDPPHGPYV